MSRKTASKGRESLRRYSFLQSLLLAGPLLILLSVFFLYPLLTLFPESLTKEGQFSLLHYEQFFREPLYTHIVFRTIKIALFVTAICFLLGYPTAYIMAELKNKKILALSMICVLLPFFTSILVRSYAWIVLLQSNGIINKFLVSIGLIKEPLNLLHNEFAVFVGMVHILLPFMILPIYSVLKNLDRNLLRAARNLGANALKAFATVTFPLSLPGVGAGVMFVFILSLGFFITPALLGGPTTLMIATLISQLVNLTMNWELAEATAVMLLMITIIILVIFNKIIGLDKIYRE